MPEDPVQILEVRADGGARAATITAAVTADASHAIFVALSEQLDRRRRDPIAGAEDLLALRQQIELVERFAPLARAGAHALVRLTDVELRACLLDLSDYRERADGEHFQPVELRRRLQLTTQIVAVLWDAHAAVAAAGHDLLSQAGDNRRLV